MVNVRCFQKTGFMTWLFVVVILSSCIENRELPYDGLNAEPGYFIECYLVPGDLYRLSATKLQPLYDDYILDYSLEFDVWVDSLKLWQGLLREENTEYIYNYGHFQRFSPLANQSVVEMEAITPEGDTVTAESTIPVDVKILNGEFDDDLVKFDFVLSEESWHNYYMININTENADTTHHNIRFLDYSHLSIADTVSFEYGISKTENIDELTVILRRITKTNYDYQISLENAKDANSDNLVLPSPLAGNLENATGIFTCYTRDSVVWNVNIAN